MNERTSMLQLQHLTITHQKDLKTLITNLHLVVNPGDKLAIIGEEGTGKSTLLATIFNPHLVSQYATIEGKINNQFSRMGYLPQQLGTSDLARSVSDFLYHDIDYSQFDFNFFYKMADQFQLPIEQFEEQNQQMSSLSGGEKLKIQLLKLLANQPDLLLFDEPSSDLDQETLIWLEHFIKNSSQAILFISHDETLLSQTATCILHLEILKKRTEARASYYKGDYASYKKERRERFEHQLQVANKEREEHAKKMARHHRIHQSVEHTLRHTHDATAGRLVAKKMKNVLSQEKRYEKEAKNFTEIPQDMDALNLFFSNIQALPTSKRILAWDQKKLDTGQIASLQIAGQDKLVITGKNGIGKTRLLQTIYEDLARRSDCSVGYMPQQYEDCLADATTPLSFLQEVADDETCRTLLANLQFTREEVNHSVRELSGGQKAKLFLAKMVLANCNILLLDEPTRHFSPTSQPIIRQLLRDFPGSIISVSHDRLFINEVCPIHYELTQSECRRLD